MHIVRVIDELRQGGLQIRLARVVRDLAARGHRVTVLCTRDHGPNAPSVRDAGVEVVLLGPCRWNSRRAVADMARAFRDLRPDIVHAHKIRQYAPATVAARLARVPRIFAQVHLVGTLRRARDRRIERALVHLRTATVTVSRVVADDVRGSLAPFPAPRLCVLHNGVECAPFDAATRADHRDSVCAEFALPPDSLVFLNAARLEKEKNHRGLLDAFAHLHARHPAARLLVAGAGTLRDELERQCADLGLRGLVVFAGDRGDIPRLMAASDVFVLPSHQEGFSNAILEAMASGLPVVASDVGGVRECITTGTNGLVVAPGDTPALAAACAGLADDPAARARMAAANRRRILDFTHQRMIERTLELYETGSLR